MDPDIADSVDFVIEKLDSLNREQLASRLTLNTVPGYVEPHHLNEQVSVRPLQGRLSHCVLTLCTGASFSCAGNFYLPH